MPNKNIYDKTFKKVLSEKAEAIALAKTYFPAQLVEDLDFSTMELLPTSFVDDQMQEHVSDIIYSCQFNSGENVWVNFIFEHKSYLPRQPEIQLLKYLSDGYNHQRQEKLPITEIIPVVLYHGNEPWKRRKIADYLQHDKAYLMKFVPTFDYILIDLAEYSDDEIFAIELGFVLRHLLLLFKHKNDEAFLLQKTEKLFIFDHEILTQEEINERNRLLFRFIIGSFNLKEKVLMDMLQEMPDTIRVEGMTTYDQIVERSIKEGIEKGVEIGIEKGKYLSKLKLQIAIILKSMLRYPDMTLTALSEYEEVPLELVQKMNKGFQNGNLKKARKVVLEQFEPFGELGADDLTEIEAMIAKYIAKFQERKQS